ncbi:ABC transporter substrate-binding protein [Paracoccus pacificus]|uniref:ABC transporter substrate-binding protein n=1 Tax=Paracoccus pacificus TaxID=1463598 RepID=A0ABW4R9U4_9RHOB
MRGYLTSTAAIVLATLGLALPAVAQDAINVVSWGGAYTDAQRQAFYEPFTAATGIKINSVDYNGGLGQIKAQVDSGNITWDVVVGEKALAEIGCFDNILEKQDTATLPPAPDGTPATEDFIEGTLSECGIGSVIWSTALAYNQEAFPNGGPQTIADFFDLEKFPGRRGLRKSADVNLEWALLADGVPRDQVYKVLETEEGVNRAFAKLDTIKDSVVWWEAGAQPPQLLADGEVVMTSAYSSRIFNAINDEKQPFTIVWDGQVWDRDVWMIPKGTQKLEAAVKFVDFASETAQQAAITNASSYGPVRKSAIALIGKNAKTGVDMKDFVPTAHLENAIESDSEFWSTYRDELFERFNSWLAS